MIHIAGPVIVVGARHRQRCSWCGAVIDDVDLTRVGYVVTDDEPFRFPEWRCGALVLVDGGMRHVVEYSDGDVLPDGCCGKLDPEVTT